MFDYIPFPSFTHLTGMAHFLDRLVCLETIIVGHWPHYRNCTCRGSFCWFLSVVFSVLLCVCEFGPAQLREVRRGGDSSQGDEKEIV